MQFDGSATLFIGEFSACAVCRVYFEIYINNATNSLSICLIVNTTTTSQGTSVQPITVSSGTLKPELCDWNKVGVIMEEIYQISKDTVHATAPASPLWDKHSS